MISFKSYKRVTSMTEEQITSLTEEQLDEIFGKFFSNKGKYDKAADAEAKKKEALRLLQADKKKRDDALMKKTADALRLKDLKNKQDDENGGFDTKERGSVTARSAAARGRAADLDWVRHAVPESAKHVVDMIAEGELAAHQVMHEPVGLHQRQVSFALKEATKRFDKTLDELF